MIRGAIPVQQTLDWGFLTGFFAVDAENNPRILRIIFHKRLYLQKNE
jgi:hypothetical protein